jgi:hypothetical protein
VARKLFCYSYKEYVAADLDQSKREDKYENISELIPKNGEIKLDKSAQKREVL